MTQYERFLEKKRITAIKSGFEFPKDRMNGMLFDWQKDIVFWALRKGRAALFEDCGLGKSAQAIQWAEAVAEHTKKPVLIVCPLAVAKQFQMEAQKFGFNPISVCREQKDVQSGVNVTNYEMLGHFDVSVFGGVVCDESGILKNYTGKIRTEIIDMFRDTPYKLSCTATPAPNDYMELGNQAEFCGVMTRTEMLATYFIHDGGDTSHWRLKGHAQHKFWEWMATWAVVLTNPRDLGYDGTGFDLPGLNTIQHTIKSDENIVGDNYSLFAGVAQTLNERREARRNSLEGRCAAAADLIAKNPNEQWILWCGLNAEADELKRTIQGAVEIRGTDEPEEKADSIVRFANGEIRYLISKASITGFGVNWQNCHNMIFVGLSDSFEMLYQAIRRCWRFGQTHEVNVHIITSEAEGAVKDNIDRKERQAAQMTAEMAKHTMDILEQEIRGTVRNEMPYNPTIEMTIPEWLKGEEVA